MTRFDPETRFYRPDDPAMRMIGTPGTLRVSKTENRNVRSR